MRDRIDDLVRRYAALDRRVSRYLRALVVLFCVSALVFTYLLAVNADRAKEARDLARTNRVLTRQIQIERARNVRDACAQTNARHDKTIVTLDRLLKRAAKTASPERLRQMKDSRTGTVLLIEALVPKRDCAQLVRDQVGSPPSVTP